jgi:hypothetical protein
MRWLVDAVKIPPFLTCPHTAAGESGKFPAFLMLKVQQLKGRATHSDFRILR